MGIPDKLAEKFSGALDEEQMEQILAQMDDAEIERGINNLFHAHVVPHLHEVRRQADGRRDPEKVRRDLEALPEEQQQEYFNEAIAKVVNTAVEIRWNPISGAESLKQLLRDPVVVESLLLVFEDDEIDDERKELLKDSAANYLQLMGVAVMPEAYDDETVKQMAEQAGLEYVDEEDARHQLRQQTRGQQTRPQPRRSAGDPDGR